MSKLRRRLKQPIKPTQHMKPKPLPKEVEKLSFAEKAKLYNILKKMESDIQKEEQQFALKLLIYLMVNVLCGEGYWEKSYKKRIPKLIDDMSDLAFAIADGTVTMKEIEDLVEIDAGEIRIGDLIIKNLMKEGR